MNFQPVVPMAISSDWNMILRWIMPYVSQPSIVDDAPPVEGFSDITTSLFFSPARPGRFIWGAGPVFQLPRLVERDAWRRQVVTGANVRHPEAVPRLDVRSARRHLWSFAGDVFTGGVARDDVSATFVQPFLTYTTSKAVTFGVNAEAQANWKADEAWTIPIHFTVSKVTRFGPFPMSIGGGIGIYAAGPNGSPDWRLRLIATLLSRWHCPRCCGLPRRVGVPHAMRLSCIGEA